MLDFVIGQVFASFYGSRSFINLPVGPLDALPLGPMGLQESSMSTIKIINSLCGTDTVTRRVDTLMIMKMASRRRDIVETPSSQS